MWECGLKLINIKRVESANMVTPHVGVWIETTIVVDDLFHFAVTPHVGVWIETTLKPTYRSWKNSHSPCGSVD